MNKPALPNNEDIAFIGLCDDCEMNDAEYSKGNGIYYKEICGHCRLLDVMSKP